VVFPRRRITQRLRRGRVAARVHIANFSSRSAVTIFRTPPRHTACESDPLNARGQTPPLTGRCGRAGREAARHSAGSFGDIDDVGAVDHGVSVARGRNTPDASSRGARVTLQCMALRPNISMYLVIRYNIRARRDFVKKAKARATGSVPKKTRPRCWRVVAGDGGWPGVPR
jgi:hypothetical protein